MKSTSDARAPSNVEVRYRALLDIGRTLAGTLDSDDLYAAIHRETCRVIESSGFYVSIYDEARDLATIVFYADQGRLQEVRVTYRGSDSEVIQGRKAILVADNLDDRRVLKLGDEAPGATRSAVSAPLIHKGRVLGAISAQSYEPNAYDEEDLDLLQGIADIAAVAIDNAVHVSELEQRRREAEQIEEIGRALTGSLDPTDVLGKVTAAVLEVLGVDRSSVWLCEGTAGTVVRVAESSGEDSLPAGVTWDLRGDLADLLLDAQKPALVEDIEKSPLIPPHVLEHLKKGTWMGVPLVVGGDVMGVLSALSRKTASFTEDDVGVLHRLASQASVALENARLHSNVQALSLTDSLTGLPNRRRLQIHLDKEVAAARRGRGLVVVVFDLDNFKHYNDTLGHVAGDDILRAFAQILDDENRAMNLVARYGGDEFVAILSESDVDGARFYSRRVGERVSQDPILSSIGITVSTGLAEFDRTRMKTSDDVIQAADADMYRVKTQQGLTRQVGSP